MKTIKIKCERCGNEFEKPQNEYNRSIKLGRKLFCSLSCSGKNSYKHLLNYSYDVSQHANNKRDQYTGFREFLRRAKNHGYEPTITLEELLKLWNNQRGKCAYTNIDLVLPTYKGKHKLYQTASLDRIDSTKNYEIDNVQFVSSAINLMKRDMTDEETKEFIELITNRE